MWNPEFEGWYFKHQKGRDTVAFIPGQAKSGAFVQVIWPEGARCFPLPALHVDRKGERIYAPGCRFGRDGISVDLPGIRGEISYGPLTPLRSDIMGPFRFFPMECRHGVLSMGHRLRGSLELPGRAVDFDGGLGYLEKDSGRSFPKSYLWLQCSDFSQPCSIFLSLARIPFCGLVFPGCICAVHFGGREYRFATYEGVKLLETGPDRIVPVSYTHLDVYKRQGRGGGRRGGAHHAHPVLQAGDDGGRHRAHHLPLPLCTALFHQGDHRGRGKGLNACVLLTGPLPGAPLLFTKFDYPAVL